MIADCESCRNNVVDMPWISGFEEPSDGLSMYDRASEHLGQLLQQAAVAASSSHTPHQWSLPTMVFRVDDMFDAGSTKRVTWFFHPFYAH
jgi:hypothetical protein